MLMQVPWEKDPRYYDKPRLRNKLFHSEPCANVRQLCLTSQLLALFVNAITLKRFVWFEKTMSPSVVNVSSTA